MTTRQQDYEAALRALRSDDFPLRDRIADTIEALHALIVPESDWNDDRPLPEDDAIKAAIPTRSGRHDLYAEAMRLVGAKRSKRALVELVNWLLHREADECLEVEAARVLLKQWQDGRGDADDTSAYLKHRIIKGVR